MPALSLPATAGGVAQVRRSPRYGCALRLAGGYGLSPTARELRRAWRATASRASSTRP